MIQVHPPDPGPVVTAHTHAEAMVEQLSIDNMLNEGMAEGPHPVMVALHEALQTRATSPAELRFRLSLLGDAMRQEDASDYAFALLEAAIADLDALLAAGQITHSQPATASMALERAG